MEETKAARQNSWPYTKPQYILHPVAIWISPFTKPEDLYWNGHKLSLVLSSHSKNPENLKPIKTRIKIWRNGRASQTERITKTMKFHS